MSQGQPLQAPKGVRLFTAPTLVRYAEATRFLWGDEESHQVADIIYGRGERISSLMYALRPGEYFKASKTWKPLYDQHRFYYVLQGDLTIHDPKSGEVARAGTGEAIYWRGAKWHFGYNFSQQETLVLDWYAPQERAPDVPEVEVSAKKPELGEVVNGRYGLLGQWPAAMRSTEQQLLQEGGMITLRRQDALRIISGTRSPVLNSLYISTDALTAGVIELLPGVMAEGEAHPGDEVIFVPKGRLNVYLPESHDWFEVNPKDSLYLPAGVVHQYCNYSDQPIEVVFAVAPRYR